MTQPRQDAPVIRPRQVSLSHHGSPPPRTRRPATATLALAGTTALLLGIGLWVFLYLPERVTAPTVVLSPAEPATTTARADRSEPEVAPYEATQRERARGHAQSSLSRLVELQIRLEEEMHVANWGQEAFDEALLTANQGDRYFIEQRYDEALALYESAADRLGELEQTGETQFETALTAGDEALRALDHDAARAAFARAAEIYPEHDAVAAGMRRSERLPEVLAALRDADRARRRDDIEATLAHLERARDLDPATPGLGRQIDEVNALLAEQAFDALLSEGYAALSRGDFHAARMSFDQALEERPNEAAARDGRRQVAQAESLERIDLLRTRAERHEADEEWQDAQRIYDELLGIDDTLVFARQGRERSRRMAELHAALTSAIRNPGRLSSPARYEETVALYERSVDVQDPGPRLDARIDELESLLRAASQPVPVTLVSDGETNVTISNVGAIGSFERRTIELRPGRYLLVGSRDGCRDVRKEVTVATNSEPIDIRCIEQI